MAEVSARLVSSESALQELRAESLAASSDDMQLR